MNPNYSRLRASIRAFYCANTFDHALNLNRNSDYIGDCANALAETLNPKLSLSYIFTIALDYERRSIVDYNLVLDRALTAILTLAIDINEKLSLDPNLPDTNLYLLTLASCFKDILTNEFIFCNPNSELEQSLNVLMGELLNLGNIELLKWWQINGLNWTEKLRAILIKYRDIGYNWQFNEYEIKKLQIYFEANKLLVECLDKASCDIHTTKEEIEANLLLPLDDTLQ
ncbi:NACHT C-terminal helical domain 2-containing protein [Nostoc sp. 2RC]|uniref:NACHT C-terminal helical domain 2-containing protein n=1 Tax=Nostoc sp. 2RC TaxID=2485484 RepID=UPI0016262FFD|nr:hypothetical protein [Nostoc sp. 2RC]MBC1237536.1 hypothetical protein [Nostoc sp. 2RC]